MDEGPKQNSFYVYYLIIHIHKTVPIRFIRPFFFNETISPLSIHGVIFQIIQLLKISVK